MMAPVPAAAALLDARGKPLCSAAMVRSRVALTAAHCVVRDGATIWPTQLFVGQDLRVGGSLLRVLGGEVHPGYDPFRHTSDLAVLRLADDLPGVEPLALATEAPAPAAALRLVGYGEGPDGPEGRQHVASVVVSDAGEPVGFGSDDRELRFSPGGCPGDSGGPLLGRADSEAPEAVVGVASTADVLCQQGRAVSVAAHAAWISAAAERLDPPACRDADDICGGGCPFGDSDCGCRADNRCELCAGFDPDCDGCIADGFCSRGCLAPDPDCNQAQTGEVCGGDFDCASSLCLDGRCRSACGTENAGACAPWETCMPVAQGRAACLDQTMNVQGAAACRMAPGGPGAPALGMLAAALAAAVAAATRTSRQARTRVRTPRPNND